MTEQVVASETTEGLLELIQLHHSLAQVADALGIARSSLTWAFRANRVTLTMFEAACAFIGIPPIALHLTLRKGQLLTVREAIQILEFCQEPKPGYRAPAPPDRSPLLEHLDRHLVDWLAREPAAEGSSRSTEILQLEEERPKDRRKTRGELEALVQELIAEPPSRSARIDLALALAIWSTMRRNAGNRRDARDGYCAALRCLAGIPSNFALGFILTKASAVLWDYDQIRLGLMLLDRALIAFPAAGRMDWYAVANFYCGMLHHALDELGESEDFLRISLANFGDEMASFRSAALQVLAHIQKNQGDPEAALKTLHEARSLNAGDPLGAAYLDWRDAEIKNDQRRHAEALGLLRNAFPLIRLQGEPLDLALLIVDIAETSLAAGNDLRPLAREFLVCAGRLAPNKDAFQALTNFLDLLRLNRLSVEVAAETRRVLEGVGRASRRPTPLALASW